MPQEHTLSHDAICKLIGRLVLDNYAQSEQYGKQLSLIQKSLNDEREENARLRGALSKDDCTGKGTNN